MNASPTSFFAERRDSASILEMSFSIVTLLVSLAVCLPYGDSKATNMIFMLMDDVSWLYN